MDEINEEKWAEIARKLSEMTFILKSYCEHYQDISEVSNLIEFSDILHQTSTELFDLL